MSDPLGYRVRVFDCPYYNPSAPVLHEVRVSLEESMPPSLRLSTALRKAEDHRVYVESVFPGCFVEVSPILE